MLSAHPVTRRLLNVVAFQVGWLACVLGAGADRPLVGPALVVILLGLQAPLSSAPLRTGRFLLVAGLLGALIDSLLGFTGLLTFQGTPWPPWVCPPWLLAIWLIFASTLPSSLRWLAGHRWLAAALGAMGGPMSYYAGARLGALTMPSDPLPSLAVLAVLWALLLTGLLRLMERMVPAEAEEF